MRPPATLAIAPPSAPAQNRRRAMSEPPLATPRTSARALRRAAAVLWLVASTCAAAQVARPDRYAEQPCRVLILSSFGSEFSFFSQMATDLRAELNLIRKEPCDYYEIPLELSRFDSEERQAPFVDYLTALMASRRPDLVVTLGGPAARVGQHYRERLFPEVPMLFAAVDVHHLDASALGPLDAAVPVENNLRALPEAILQLLPETRHLAIVLGDSPLERFWRAQLSRDFARFEPALEMIWLDGLSLEETTERVATLPPQSAVFLAMLLVDSAGTAYSQDRVLAAISERSHAPVFGLFDNQVGAGIVGGPVMPLKQVSRRSAEAAARLLGRAAPAEVRLPPVRVTAALFDGRQLARWSIPESRLPPGSEVLFRPVSPLALYRWPVLGGLGVVALEAALIVGLLAQRARRRSAESEIRSLHGKLLQTYELERRRLARELHDDLTQRLARLAIDAAQLERQGPANPGGASLRHIRQELATLSEDVHSLARQLHPSILDDLGLAEALRSEGERFAREARVEVDLELAEIAPKPAHESALCLFRVAQEALRNVAHHARASRVAILLRRAGEDLELEVRDNGVGFDPGAGSRRGIGHVSLRERLHLVGGRLEIASAPGSGTSVLARVPLAGGAS